MLAKTVLLDGKSFVQMYRYFFSTLILYYIRIARNVCTIFLSLPLIVALRVSQTYTLRCKAAKYFYVLIYVDLRTRVSRK